MPLQSQPTPAVATGPSAPTAAVTTSRARWWSLLAVCLGVMMAFVNVTSTVSALSAIETDLHTSASELVWISSSYSLIVVSLVMSAGTLGDLVGRRITFLGGAVVFVASSLLAVFAGSPGMLIAAQALMGVGGAALLPNSLAIVSHTFTDPHERTSAISVWASCSGLGLAIGPVVAGVLLNHFSWHSVFLTDIGLGVVTIILALLLVPESKHPSRRLDPAGVVLGTVVVASATYAIIEGASAGYGAARIVVMYVIFAVSFAAFVVVELRHPDPMLDLRLFRNPSFAAVMAVSATTLFGFVGVALLSVLYLERVKQLSALDTGLRLLVMFVSYIVVSSIAARLVRRVGFAAMLGTGLLVMGVGALLLLATGPSNGFGAMWPGLLVAGIGSGLLVAPSTAAAVNSVSPLQAGMASGAVNMFRQLGNVLGPSVLGTIVTTRFPHNLSDRLLAAHVPPATTSQIVQGATHGASPASLPAALRPVVISAVDHGFTDAMHVGLTVGGIVLVAMSLPALLLVRHK